MTKQEKQVIREENVKKFLNIIKPLKEDYKIKYKVLKTKINFTINRLDAEYNLLTNIVESFDYIDLPLEEFIETINDSKEGLKALYDELSNGNDFGMGMVYLAEGMWLTSDGDIIPY